MGAARANADRLIRDEVPGARAYAQKLLADLAHTFPSPAGEGAASRVEVSDDHPAVAWARSGLMALTGFEDGEPLMCPAPLASCADGALAALQALSGATFNVERGSQLLAVRAAIAGYWRRGTVSPGGSCRLLPAADGLLAVNLARDSDWELLPAWLETDCEANWEALATVIPAPDRSTRGQAAAGIQFLVDRARMLGLAVAPSVPPSADVPPWFRVTAKGEAAKPRRSAPRVIDLSSLWAGPLCGQLLRQCGAQVVKVESRQRPDGARAGPRAFFDLLNAGKEEAELDLESDAGRLQLQDLLAGADIVIEGSRPRGLRQLGIDAEALVQSRPGLTWISLTGYGRAEPQGNWIAYGDDAGVAAGLSDLMQQATGQACIVGDAIADPLTGLHAALAAWASWSAGGGRLLSLPLSAVVRHCIDAVPSKVALRERQREWTALAGPAARPAVLGYSDRPSRLEEAR